MMIIYPPEPQSIYNWAQVLLHMRADDNKRRWRKSGCNSKTGRQVVKLLAVADLTSGSNLNLTTRSAVCSSQYGLQLPLKPQTAYRTTAASPPVSLYTSKLLSLISTFSTSFLSPHAHSGCLYVIKTWPPSLSGFLISEAQSWRVFFSVWVQPVSQTVRHNSCSVLSVFPHLTLSPAVLISVVQSYSITLKEHKVGREHCHPLMCLKSRYLMKVCVAGMFFKPFIF